MFEQFEACTISFSTDIYRLIALTAHTDAYVGLYIIKMELASSVAGLEFNLIVRVCGGGEWEDY